LSFGKTIRLTQIQRTVLLMERRTGVVLVTLCCFCSFLLSQPANETVPAARIDSIFADLAKGGPGCSVGVMRAGDLLYERAFGMADLAHEVPLTPTTPVFIASSSKQFTALAVLLLIEEGKLHLSDDVRKLVPEMSHLPAAITVQQLLQHTSGLREQWNLFYMSGWRSSDLETADDLLNLLKMQRGLNHPPGEEFSYNNTGYSVLALIVERVSGQRFPNFVQSRIFQPLGMTASFVRDDAGAVVPGLAVGYWGRQAPNLRQARVPYSFAGPTGVITNIEDLAKWDRNFYEPKVGSPATIRKMIQTGQLNDETDFGYGAGLFIGTYKGHLMVSHAGSDPGYKADVVRFPDERLTIAVLCNTFDVFPTPLALRVADLILPDVASRSVGAPAGAHRTVPAKSAEFAGLYWNGGKAQTRQFYFEDGKLLLDGGGEGKFALAALGDDRFQLMEAPRQYVFRFYRRGASLYVEETIEGSPRVTFQKEAKGKPSLAMLQRLPGVYYSPELDVRWTVELRDGTLILLRHRLDAAKLKPVFGTVFQAEDFFVLQFSIRGEPQLDVSTDRARHVKFVKESRANCVPNPMR
jgi:CubicO group peptidase (beta-lactamase class C family)